MSRVLLVAIALPFLSAVAPLPAAADEVTDFYKGKTINIYIGVGVGGEYDLHARLIAKYIGRHVPGRPNVVAQNMTGASGLRMLTSSITRRLATAPRSA